MNNSHRLLFPSLSLSTAALLLACAPGCSKDAPAPGPSTETQTSADGATLVEGDIVPARIFAMAPNLEGIAKERIAVSNVASPRVPIKFVPTVPFVVKSKAALVQVMPNSVETTKGVPVDTTDGAAVMMVPTPSEPKLYETVLGDMALFEPSGRLRMDLRAPKFDVLNTSTEFKAAPTIEFTAKNAKGTYVFKIGKAAAKNGVTIYVNMPASPIEMELVASKPSAEVGSGATVDVSLANEGLPVDGAALEGEMLRPDSTLTKVEVRSVAPGKYAVLVADALKETDRPGDYIIRVRARGEANGVKFDRFASLSVQWRVPTGKLLSASAPRTLLDPMGRVSGYEVDVDVQAATLDRFELSAALAVQMPDGTERAVVGAQTAETFGEGRHTVTLHFDASQAALGNIEGTLVLRNLTLFSQGWAAPLHRLGRALDVKLGVLQLAKLVAPAKLTPATEELMLGGGFDVEYTK